MIINNFRTSLKLLPPTGKLVGKDQLGNEYYEGPLNTHSYKKSASRWFKPQKDDDWQQDLPAEWEAWLRGRRKDPPTEEEIRTNLSIAGIKKVKGAEIEAKYKKETSEPEKTSAGFPKLKDYEIEAGQFSDKKK
ncbi:hypothetical protein JTE90_024927 [Oedothorax gibbosus]|uniref:NADH dehydrogenase [ubiquinone] 1 alpha subcomplex assembly factor 2 n=1 Tax=Oedothorax gibbosus TaxID=931172 RepID=A0AAV6TYX9_9ARAC|nr:hypothetical protein JTE90_024927 [Oedothorax gibbosus]